jgi:hypothetical protein
VTTRQKAFTLVTRVQQRMGREDSGCETGSLRGPRMSSCRHRSICSHHGMWYCEHHFKKEKEQTYIQMHASERLPLSSCCTIGQRGHSGNCMIARVRSATTVSCVVKRVTKSSESMMFQTPDKARVIVKLRSHYRLMLFMWTFGMTCVVSR